MKKPDPRMLREIEDEFPRAFASRPDPFVPGYTYSGKPIPDEFGEVPIDCFPGAKIRTVGELASDLSRDKRFLLVENAQLHQAFRQKAIEAHNLRKQLNRRPAWTWTFGFAAITFFITTIGLLLAIGGRI